MTEYYITFKKQFKYIWVILIDIIIAIFFLYFMTYKFGKQDFYLYIKIVTVIFLPPLIPTLYIHITYYIKNKNDLLIFDSDNEKLLLSNVSYQIEVSLNDIKCVIQYLTPALSEKRVGWLPWDSYNYFKFVLKDKREFTFTCLILDEFIIPIDLDKQEIRKVFLPYIRI